MKQHIQLKMVNEKGQKSVSGAHVFKCSGGSLHLFSHHVDLLVHHHYTEQKLAVHW